MRTIGRFFLVVTLASCGKVEGVASDAGSDAASAVDATPPPDSEVQRCPQGMAFLPDGSYEMREKPGTVDVAPFCMDVTHVTSEDYAGCDACSDADTGSECNAGIASRDADPANCVDLAQAAAYCASLDKRLPTEEQWEWAARGGPAGHVYPWGDQIPAAADNPALLCWFAGRDDVPFPGRPSGTCPSGDHGQAAVHPFGLEDMSGNVWQWTASLGTNPDTRVVRGGGWDNTDPTRMTSGFRNDVIPPTVRHPALGFRCVQPPLE